VSQPSAYMGIDPGLSGAIAVYRPEDGHVTCYDMPTFEVKGKRQIDFYGLARIVDTFHLQIKKAVIEEVGAKPRYVKGKPVSMGAASSFKFGKAAGAVEGVVAANFIPVRLVGPGVWKRKVGLPAGSDKGASRQLACRLFPQFSHYWARVKDDGRAEAALLAIFGSKEP